MRTNAKSSPLPAPRSAWTRTLFASLAPLLLLPSLAAAPAPVGLPTVALVVGLRGEAVRSGGGGARPAPLRLFDKLAAGTVIETRPAAEVRLVFATGGRYAIGSASRVRLTGTEPVRQSGTMNALARLPAALALAPIAPEDEPGDRFPTIVIRAQPIPGVYPRGAVTLSAGEAVLQFGAVPGTERYGVTVSEWKTGNPVFKVETPETRVAVPPALLKPGTRYLWSVVTVGRIGARAEGKGGFVTYTPEAESARAALDATLAGEPEGDALLTRAAVDLSLGRFREAYDELVRAQGQFPEDEALQAAVEIWRRRLELRAPASPGAPPRPSDPPPPP